MNTLYYIFYFDEGTFLIFLSWLSRSEEQKTAPRKPAPTNNGDPGGNKIAFALKLNSHWWFMRQNITMVNIDEVVWWNDISGTARSGDRVSPCSSEVFFFANCLTNSILEKIQILTSSSSLFSGKIYLQHVCATYFMRQKLNQPQRFLSHAFLGFLDMRNFCQCGFHLSFLFWGWP